MWNIEYLDECVARLGGPRVAARGSGAGAVSQSVVSMSNGSLSTVIRVLVLPIQCMYHCLSSRHVPSAYICASASACSASFSGVVAVAASLCATEK